MFCSLDALALIGPGISAIYSIQESTRSNAPNFIVSPTLNVSNSSGFTASSCLHYGPISILVLACL